ncbi:hypothetical protein [Sabulicella rubraurantiaca]|uniref:hypothetical protein n=1 Tax=Sabulicella rubraurantiaca TaxID=2811429 RepID=UPI001A968A19|nr:hypothetical protein [Sabulicella rubraurantiaca]
MALLTLMGCGNRYFTDRATNPVLEDYVSERSGEPLYGMLSSSAGRRTVLVQMPRAQQVRVCPEPPADAVEAYANAVAASVQAGGANRASFGTEASRTFATAATPMLYRSQGLQLARDQAFQYCAMFMQRVIDERTYIQLMRDLLPPVERIIKAEMPALRAAASRPAVTVAPVLSGTVPPARAATEAGGQRAGSSGGGGSGETTAASR